jgi:hypothetical protein
MEHPKSVEIIPFEGPRDLATVTARPPALLARAIWEFLFRLFTAGYLHPNAL